MKPGAAAARSGLTARANPRRMKTMSSSTFHLARLRSLTPLAAALALTALPLGAQAAPVWVGDMETNDLTQWNNALNGEHITVVGDPVVEGSHAAHIELTNDAVWPNGLKRVELHHSPAAGRTAEGKELYFAWSFYLDQTMPEDPTAQIGYWETASSYHQLMAFELSGEHVKFFTHYPDFQVQWEADGKATASVWHRIAMHVKWSQDPSTGYVDIWYDGEQVLTHGAAQTLFDENEAFTQVGLLRGAVEFSDAPVIVLDDAVEGDSLDDVHPALPNEGTGGAGATASSTGASPSSSTSAATNASSAASGASTTGSGGAGGAGSGSGSDDGCGCRVADPSTELSIPSASLAGVAAAAFFFARRRRTR